MKLTKESLDTFMSFYDDDHLEMQNGEKNGYTCCICGKKIPPNNKYNHVHYDENGDSLGCGILYTTATQRVGSIVKSEVASYKKFSLVAGAIIGLIVSIIIYIVYLLHR